VSKSKQKKPTIKQITKVLNRVIQEINQIKDDIYTINFVFGEYVGFKKENEKFTKHMEKVVDEKRKKDAENRTSDSLSDNK